jgi:hypothetical protein
MSRTFARLRLSAGAMIIATGLTVPSLASAQTSPAPYMSAMRYDAQQSSSSGKRGGSICN